MQDSSIATVLILSLAMPYALVLAAPGPNLLVVLGAGLSPTSRGPAAAAFGIACGATLATVAAAYGATFIGAAGSFEWAGTLIFAGILARSAARLLTIAPQQIVCETPLSAAVGAGGGAFAAGLIVALSNPMTLPFFLSFFISQPLARTEAGVAISCATVFTMASVWFLAIGLLFAKIGSRGLDGGGPRLRRALAVLMLAFAAASLARMIAR